MVPCGHIVHLDLLYTLRFPASVGLESYPTYLCCTHSSFLSLSVYSHILRTYVVHTQVSRLCQFIFVSYIPMLYTLKFPVFISLYSYPTYLCCTNLNFLSLSVYIRILRTYVVHTQVSYLCQFIFVSYVPMLYTVKFPVFVSL